MTTSPDEQPQPSRSGQPAPSPGREPGKPTGCLTAAEIAELNRQGWEGPASEDDPRYFDDPKTAAPECWLALPPAEQAREIEEDLPGPAPGVPEAIAAGFTHRRDGNGSGFEAGGVQDVMLPGSVLAGEVGRVSQAGLKHLSDDALVGYLQASQKLESWASANKHDAVLELDNRRAQPDGRETHRTAASVTGRAVVALRSWF